MFGLKEAVTLLEIFRKCGISSVRKEGNTLLVDSDDCEAHINCTPETRWISVEEYLPSMEQLVLFVDKHRPDFCVHVGKLNFIGAKNAVYFQTRGCGRYHNAIAASHWMPLPRNPREVE